MRVWSSPSIVEGITAHEVDRAAKQLGELKSQTVEDAVLAVVSFGLALAASWYLPSLAIPLTVGAMVMTILAGRAFVKRFWLIEDLAADDDAYRIPAVHDYVMRSVLVRTSLGAHADAADALEVEDRAMQTSILRCKSEPVPFLRARVADVMTEGLITCAPSTPLRSVARLMATHRVHSVFVLDYEHYGDNVELWGLVSDLDLVAAAWADVDHQTAGESAVTPLVYVSRDDDLRHAAQLMAESGVSHLAVVDPVSQRPIGVISTLDIARAIVD